MRLFLAALLLCVLPLAAEAKQSGHAAAAEFAGDRYATHIAQSAYDVTRAMSCPPPACQRGYMDKAKHLHPTKRRQTAPRSVPRPRTAAPLTLAQGIAREGKAVAATIIGGRPPGCPHQFCGCGASLHLFGRIIPALNLAANWLRFPRTEPAPNMVAARRGHVFVLKRHIAGKTWLVFDANSGGHRTRIHPRSIAGFAIVNPRSGRA